MTKVSASSQRIFSHPVMIAHMVLVAAPIALLMVPALRSIRQQTIMVSFAFGWLLWTFFEYGFNRWLLHAEGCGLFFVRAIFRHHARHHKEPENIRYGFPHPLIILIP